MRINKYIATAGVASRRKAEELITAGKVKVNNKVVTNLATDIKETDHVSIDGKTLHIKESFVYYKLHKPKGFVSTVNDEKDRKTVMELMRGVHARIFPVGRLDYDTEGLLLLTNDGDLANILTRPNSEIKKIYNATIEGSISKDEIKTLSSGVEIDGYKTKPCSIVVLDQNPTQTKLAVTITEGKNRQIRKMFETVNKTVKFLKRVQIGEIRLGGLSRGEYAPLNAKEMKYVLSLKK